MSKKSLAYSAFKSKESIFVNDASSNYQFNIDLECDGVFGSVDTRCVLSTPVIATSADGVEKNENAPELSKSLSHRKHTLELEKQRRVIGVVQAFNKRMLYIYI